MSEGDRRERGRGVTARTGCMYLGLEAFQGVLHGILKPRSVHWVLRLSLWCLARGQGWDYGEGVLLVAIRKEDGGITIAQGI